MSSRRVADWGADDLSVVGSGRHQLLTGGHEFGGRDGVVGCGWGEGEWWRSGCGGDVVSGGVGSRV